MSTSLITSAPKVIPLTIKDKAALYAVYIPLFANGGIFVPSQLDPKLGDELFLLLTLPGDTQRYSVAGRVAWVTPASAVGKRKQGVGVQFPSSDNSIQLKAKIEDLLGSVLDSDRSTLTI